MKLKNLSMSSTKAFALVHDDSSVTSYLQEGWDVRFDYLLIPPLVDPILVKLPGCTILVSNGSKSTVKWPVTGAYSKWNALEWPYTVVTNGVDFADKFEKVVNTPQAGWSYPVDNLPIYRSDAYAYYKAGDYDPIEQVGAYLVESGDYLYMDDRTYVRTIGLYRGNLIRECPPFTLPNRIQLRIALVRVKEN